MSDEPQKYMYCMYPMPIAEAWTDKYPCHADEEVDDFILELDKLEQHPNTVWATEEELRKKFAAGPLDVNLMKTKNSSEVSVLIVPTFIQQSIKRLSSDPAGAVTISLDKLTFGEYSAYIGDYGNSTIYIHQ